MKLLRRILQHPLTAGLSLDDPGTTRLRQRIIQSKPFLRKIYGEWYRMLVRALPAGSGSVLELGSGGGFLKEFHPAAITSELFHLPGIDLVLDGRRLPFAPGSLRAILLLDVLHHIPDVEAFFRAAARAVRLGGRIAMIEPWVTPWSSLVYRHLHHEPFEPEAASWELSPDGPLSGANQALPWILFQRARKTFQKRHPCWTISRIHPFMPFRYLVSGGVGMRSLMPGWSHGAWRGLERLLAPWMDRLAMFAFVLLERRGSDG